MGGASTGGGDVADATLNVVPFIDLLVCLICFLLISATWTQLSRINVDQALPKASKTPPKEPPKPEPKINVAVTPSGYKVNLFNSEAHPELATPTVIPVEAGDPLRLCRGQPNVEGCPGDKIETFKRYDKAKLNEKLSEFLEKGGIGDKIKVMVAAADKIEYLHLIGTLDAVLKACTGEGESKVCLQSPSVGDINLLRASGFTDFN